MAQQSFSAGRAQSRVEWYLNQAEAKRCLKPAEAKYHRRGGLHVSRKMRSLFKLKGHARRAPKRKYKADGRTWTAPYRKWRREAKRRPPSPPGTPPYTYTGTIRRAVLYAFDVSRQVTVIGPAHSVIRTVAALHEAGGTFHGRRYPARPFRQAALDKAKTRLVKLWEDSFGPR